MRAFTLFKHCTGEYPVIKGQSTIMISSWCRRRSESKRVELSWASQSFSFHLQIKRSRSWFQFYGRQFPWVSNVTCLKLGDETFNLNRSIALSRGRCISTFFHFHRWHLHRPSHHFRLYLVHPRRPSSFYPRFFFILPVPPLFRPSISFHRSFSSPFSRYRFPAAFALVRFLTDSATIPARKRSSP